MVFTLVYGLGENMAHQLSNENDERISTPKEVLRLKDKKVTNVGCGDKFTVLCTDDHLLYTIGDNDYGQLSLGHFRACTSWTSVNLSIQIESLVCGDYHSMLLSDRGEVYACGRSDKYQIGFSSTDSVAEFRRVPIKEKIKLISSGASHSIFVTVDNEIMACGDNTYSQISSKKKEVFKKPEKIKIDELKGKKIKSVASGYQHTIYLTEEGNVFCLGNNTFGQLNISLVSINKAGQGQIIESISCGSFHSVVVTDKGEAWAAGKNRNGELGIENDGSNVKDATRINIGSDVKIDTVKCGNHHTVLRSTEQRIYCAGKNSGGQLGLGHLDKTFRVNETKFSYPVSKIGAGGYHSVFTCEVADDMIENN
ncbi:hypothetical protein FDP41_010329 [Naegleria fowleri]|uniref:RCC1-like domain-containing protein n=1 Tax=Naegleria fowleri TaxID=5763 RepID=A0A6A5C9Q2_NAEFO|nr:uncharacterized protein FDP41_010329 [Naegleria fowleri]KAF0983264.1 hypothetical protein FDP41_010329 [Naegleria fowleri]CAG4716556.1 unnamed protein product [Naegleria fowleri]